MKLQEALQDPYPQFLPSLHPKNNNNHLHNNKISENSVNKYEEFTSQVFAENADISNNQTIEQIGDDTQTRVQIKVVKFGIIRKNVISIKQSRCQKQSENKVKQQQQDNSEKGFIRSHPSRDCSQNEDNWLQQPISNKNVFAESNERQKPTKKQLQQYFNNNDESGEQQNQENIEMNYAFNKKSKQFPLNQIQKKKQEQQNEAMLNNSSNFNPSRYLPGKIIQFNPENQKYILTESKQIGKNQRNIQNFYQDFEIPKMSCSPTLKNIADELVDIAKINFKELGCTVTDQTVISVKKYRNCVHFSISQSENILWYFDGKFYYGGWKNLNDGNGQKDGAAIEYLQNQYKFKGYYISGKKAGFGTYINQNGSVYAGQYENGYRHGLGIFRDSEGVIYDGEWKTNKKSGFGKIYNIFGELEFQGVFAKGLKNGHGKQYFTNGDTYEGEYLENRFDGQGVYKWSDGSVYKGEFKVGQKDGFGRYKSGKNGDIYEGFYKGDLKNGKGIYKWPNGSKYQGSFKNDNKDGSGTMTYENGKVAHLIWKNGKVQQKAKQIPSNQNQEQTLIGLNQRGKYRTKVSRSSSEHQIKPALLKKILIRERSAQSSLGRFDIQPKINAKKSEKNINFLHKTPMQIIMKSKQNTNRFDQQNNWPIFFENKKKSFSNTNTLKKPKQNNNQFQPSDRPYKGLQFSSSPIVNM